MFKNTKKRGKHKKKNYASKEGASVAVEVKSDDLVSVCTLCSRGHISDSVASGQLYRINNIVVHYFCLLFSYKSVQSGEDDEGLFGFLPSEVRKIVAGSRQVACTYCNQMGGTCRCVAEGCRTTLHFPCGFQQGATFQWNGNMDTYCKQHRIVQSLECPADRTCMTCLGKVPEDIGLWEQFIAPCCNRFFHMKCLQRFAMSAGETHFKCPNCQDKGLMMEESVRMGIYIPTKDADWEKPEERPFYTNFQDIDNPIKNFTCRAQRCMSTAGRRRHSPGSADWTIKHCVFCGTNGVHKKCGKLSADDYACIDCGGTVPLVGNTDRQFNPSDTDTEDNSTEAAGLSDPEITEIINNEEKIVHQAIYKKRGRKKKSEQYVQSSQTEDNSSQIPKKKRGRPKKKMRDRVEEEKYIRKKAKPSPKTKSRNTNDRSATSTLGMVLIQRDANGMYICVYCGDTFTKKETLITHIKSNHKDQKDVRCQICQKSFFSSLKLQQHIVTHSRSVALADSGEGCSTLTDQNSGEKALAFDAGQNSGEGSLTLTDQDSVERTSHSVLANRDSDEDYLKSEAKYYEEELKTREQRQFIIFKLSKLRINLKNLHLDTASTVIIRPTGNNEYNIISTTSDTVTDIIPPILEIVPPSDNPRTGLGTSYSTSESDQSSVDQDLDSEEYDEQDVKKILEGTIVYTRPDGNLVRSCLECGYTVLDNDKRILIIHVQNLHNSKMVHPKSTKAPRKKDKKLEMKTNLPKVETSKPKTKVTKKTINESWLVATKFTNITEKSKHTVPGKIEADKSSVPETEKSSVPATMNPIVTVTMNPVVAGKCNQADKVVTSSTNIVKLNIIPLVASMPLKKKIKTLKQTKKTLSANCLQNFIKSYTKEGQREWFCTICSDQFNLVSEAYNHFKDKHKQEQAPSLEKKKRGRPRKTIQASSNICHTLLNSSGVLNDAAKASTPVRSLNRALDESYVNSLLDSPLNNAEGNDDSLQSVSASPSSSERKLVKSREDVVSQAKEQRQTKLDKGKRKHHEDFTDTPNKKTKRTKSSGNSDGAMVDSTQAEIDLNSINSDITKQISNLGDKKKNTVKTKRKSSSNEVSSVHSSTFSKTPSNSPSNTPSTTSFSTHSLIPSTTHSSTSASFHTITHPTTPANHSNSIIPSTNHSTNPSTDNVADVDDYLTNTHSVWIQGVREQEKCKDGEEKDPLELPDIIPLEYPQVERESKLAASKREIPQSLRNAVTNVIVHAEDFKDPQKLIIPCVLQKAEIVNESITPDLDTDRSKGNEEVLKNESVTETLSRFLPVLPFEENNSVSISENADTHFRSDSCTLAENDQALAQEDSLSRDLTLSSSQKIDDVIPLEATWMKACVSDVSLQTSYARPNLQQNSNPRQKTDIEAVTYEPHVKPYIGPDQTKTTIPKTNEEPSHQIKHISAEQDSATETVDVRYIGDLSISECRIINRLLKEVYPPHCSDLECHTSHTNYLCPREVQALKTRYLCANVDKKIMSRRLVLWARLESAVEMKLCLFCGQRWSVGRGGEKDDIIVHIITQCDAKVSNVLDSKCPLACPNQPTTLSLEHVLLDHPTLEAIQALFNSYLKSALKTPTTTSTTASCCICDKVAADPHSLRMHFWMQHAEAYQHFYTQLGIDRFKCIICNLELEREEFRRHMGFNHQDFDPYNAPTGSLSEAGSDSTPRLEEPNLINKQSVANINVGDDNDPLKIECSKARADTFLESSKPCSNEENTVESTEEDDLIETIADSKISAKRPNSGRKVRDDSKDEDDIIEVTETAPDSGTRTPVAPTVPTSSRRKRKYQCAMCKAFFSRFIILQQHLGKMHFWAELHTMVPFIRGNFACPIKDCTLTNDAQSVVLSHLITQHDIVFNMARRSHPDYWPVNVDEEGDDTSQHNQEKVRSVVVGYIENGKIVKRVETKTFTNRISSTSEKSTSRTHTTSTQIHLKSVDKNDESVLSPTADKPESCDKLRVKSDQSLFPALPQPNLNPPGEPRGSVGWIPALPLPTPATISSNQSTLEPWNKLPLAQRYSSISKQASQYQGRN